MIKKFILLTILVSAAWGINLYHKLPNPAHLATINPQTSSFIKKYCNDCEIQWTDLKDISPFMIKAVLLAEDTRFYEHNGFDSRNIMQAMQANLREGKIVWGASTITMQLAKNLYLAKDKTVTRKLKEVLLTYKLEQSLSKERILELYLNLAQWGPKLYGITNASEHYFNQPPHQLGPLEASFLASILPNPTQATNPNWRNHFAQSGSLIFEHLLRN